MFDELFNNLKNNLKEFVTSKVEEAGKELEKRFGVPEAIEPFTLIRRFTTADSTVTQGGIAINGETWQIEAYNDGYNQQLVNISEPLRSVILFEVVEPDVQECVLACRFYARALNTEKSIRVCLGFARKGQWGTTTTYRASSLTQSGDFQLYETRAHYKKETDSCKIQITVQFESSGILLIRDIELLQAAVKPQPSN
ncbi:hypothetical protein DSM106972_006660 [Dulcicalothrix desertica PCC 7102]|uniref:Uncharacterized protein n=1 Tax=Dulcicalothrix desertica PCC 7102 TaxID=232991 RepID=A0A433VVQ1_9CYAN|nr:hypothetical protein [Dulcicalothrix desertica]RUT10171.1 hypothetical protein DSM106972_006660 [Dulcicalothrix desertica PCC 7102]TWH40847.1 hypothetical protein CAL7102_10208 [Dulcicalothrix desertica PCC 7102]